MSELYVGLMSGTSLDGIDAALVAFSNESPKLVGHYYQPLKPELKKRIQSLREPSPQEILQLAELDVLLGHEFATAVTTLLNQQSLTKDRIRAIGSHGQTIRHLPNHAQPFTLQIGDPNIIAASTGITTVADFRRRDIAAGGQGAPLVPAFHQAVFYSDKINRAVINIGGIANVTLLPNDSSEPIIGFDTGPGNTLLDSWVYKHLQQPYDKNGDWAQQGKIHQPLLTQLLNDYYFKLPPPKSTGQEYFNLTWLQNYLPRQIDPVDVQTTLVEFTARSIIDSITRYLPHGELFICGGGAHNTYLLSRIRTLAPQYTIHTTEKIGISPDWIEAMAFAWLAKQTLDKKPGNITSVTGAKQPAILGGVYFA